jgi:hypothetical protein
VTGDVAVEVTAMPGQPLASSLEMSPIVHHRTTLAVILELEVSLGIQAKTNFKWRGVGHTEDYTDSLYFFSKAAIHMDDDRQMIWMRGC